MSVNIGEAEIAALESVAQFLVIDSQQMKHCGVEIMDVNGIFGDVVAEIIRRAVDVAAFDSGAGHPQ